jgi:hypothetical protein
MPDVILPLSSRKPVCETPAVVMPSSAAGHLRFQTATVDFTLSSRVVDVIRLSVRRFLGKVEGSVEAEFHNLTPAHTLGFWAKANPDVRTSLTPDALTKGIVDAFGEPETLVLEPTHSLGVTISSAPFLPTACVFALVGT